MVLDKEVSSLIIQEKNRQLEGVELIASENFTSSQVMSVTGSILTNKYAEGYPGKRYYGGCEVVDEIEKLAIERAKELFNVVYANVQPHSGSQANTAIFHSFLKPGDKMLGFDLAHGGHLTHGSPVNFSGRLYQANFYGVQKESGVLDYDNILDVAKKVKPNMIIAGASAYSRDINYENFRLIADKVGAFLLADISHPSGLIVSGLHSNPVKHCHVISTTTHKTLRGPRGGLILMGQDFENPFGEKYKSGKIKMMSSLIDMGVFPGNQGGPLEHVIAAKAVAFKECINTSFKKYSSQVIKNSKAMSDAFKSLGYNVVSGGTDNHLFLLDLRNKGVDGKSAELALVKAHITVNKNMVPFDDKSPFITSGIRIGTPAITTRGLLENEVLKIVELINKVILNISNDKIINKVSNEIKSIMKDKPLFKVD